MSKIKCRCCGAEIGRYGWNKHVEKHKREFCRAIGRLEGEYWRVNWEDVVKFFNPKEANEEKCIGYPTPKSLTRLSDFMEVDDAQSQ